MCSTVVLRHRLPMLRKGGAHRLRRGSVSEAGRAYLVTTVTHTRYPLFADLQRGRQIVRALHGTADRAETLCYVVMPDHIHWLIRLRSAAQLAATVQKAKSLATRYIHSVSAWQGAVWQRGFHDRAIRDGEDVRAIARYVVANPVRAGLASSLRWYSLWDAVWLEDGDEPGDLFM